MLFLSPGPAPHHVLTFPRRGQLQLKCPSSPPPRDRPWRAWRLQTSEGENFVDGDVDQEL